ncbi:uncharacterized protein TNCT_129201 [Trichonephila clavata]|uniref:Ig-like domain-containing protein n=1 Tax=Trichonephila clavata TaxID=2740835 RepID=A0A8X6H4P3_TRICU|nr:uncharacterized protein TNCT_129201 [Trichonephila clavata]
MSEEESRRGMGALSILVVGIRQGNLIGLWDSLRDGWDRRFAAAVFVKWFGGVGYVQQVNRLFSSKSRSNQVTVCRLRSVKLRIVPDLIKLHVGEFFSSFNIVLSNKSCHMVNRIGRQNTNVEQKLIIEEKIETVIAVEGGKVDLQCDITPPSSEDDVALVLWYKDESTTPLYSLDSRRRGLYQAKHAPGQEIMGRAFLDMSTHPTVLKLEKLKAEDEGEYRCRVDFKIARSRNSLVILEIIIPPKKPVIKDSDGEILQRVSGAHNLGSRLLLICEVEGGRCLTFF